MEEESEKILVPTIYEQLRNIADTSPETEAVSLDGENFAYEDVMTEVDILAAAFDECNVSERTVVTICLPDNLQKLFCTFALNKIGAFPYLIEPGVEASELSDLMKKQGSECLVIMDSMIDEYKEMLTVLDPGMVVVCKKTDYFSFAKKRFRKLVDKEGTTACPKDAFYTTYIQMRRFGKEIVTGKINDTYDWPSAFEEVEPEKEKEKFVPKISPEEAVIMVCVREEGQGRKLLTFPSERAAEMPEFLKALINPKKVSDAE